MAQAPTSSTPTSVPGRALAASAGLVVALGGCASAGGQNEAVATTALRFARVAERDPAQACGLLAQQTRRALERTAKQPCARALRSTDLPTSSAVSKVTVAGHSAQAVLDQDTVFLGRYEDGWRVTAAGCRHDGTDENTPYDCELSKG